MAAEGLVILPGTPAPFEACQTAPSPEQAWGGSFLLQQRLPSLKKPLL